MQVKVGKNVSCPCCIWNTSKLPASTAKLCWIQDAHRGRLSCPTCLTAKLITSPGLLVKSHIPHSPTHPLTHPPTHSLTYSFTHSLTHSLTHSHSLTPSLPPSLTHSLTHSLTLHIHGLGLQEPWAVKQLYMEEQFIPVPSPIARCILQCSSSAQDDLNIPSLKHCN